MWPAGRTLPRPGVRGRKAPEFCDYISNAFIIIGITIADGNLWLLGLMEYPNSDSLSFIKIFRDSLFG
jgi:hypothetical protein